MPIKSPFVAYINFVIYLIFKNLKKTLTMDKKNVWKMVIQTLISILTAIGTTLGITSCVL